MRRGRADEPGEGCRAWPIDSPVNKRQRLNHRDSSCCRRNSQEVASGSAGERTAQRIAAPRPPEVLVADGSVTPVRGFALGAAGVWQRPLVAVRAELEAGGDFERVQVIEERPPSFLLDGAVPITGEVDRTTAFETGFLPEMMRSRRSSAAFTSAARCSNGSFKPTVAALAEL